ncbi:hypothetical protein [Aliterella atlantica]|uniref:Replication protein RepU n=1 Tax=Aliterella atlantica CENA595 TaxID=1618023 RepID=A0A0D8ZYK6_9CYAN|nr:hypothetical protein [Aliterella atlantica]KJH72281.1 hypothetical protein UH38_07590 [Aliterella atlantica CENA595]
MADTIEYDLKEILTRLEGRFDKLDTKIDRLDEKIDKVSEDLSSFKIKVAEDNGALRSSMNAGFGELRTDLTRVENSLKGEVEVLAEKVDGISKRVDTQEFINRGVIIGLIIAVLGGFAKVFGLTN